MLLVFVIFISETLIEALNLNSLLFGWRTDVWRFFVKWWGMDQTITVSIRILLFISFQWILILKSSVSIVVSVIVHSRSFPDDLMKKWKSCYRWKICAIVGAAAVEACYCTFSFPPVLDWIFLALLFIKDTFLCSIFHQRYFSNNILYLVWKKTNSFLTFFSFVVRIQAKIYCAKT